MDQIQVDRAEYERLKKMEANLFPETEPQKLDTGKYGEIFVVRTFAMNEKKIHKLADGGYCHDSGAPIVHLKELEVIEPGPDRDEAIHWFKHRHEKDEETSRGIVVHPDLTLTFTDGQPVTSIMEITQAIKPGTHQEFLIRCFMEKEGKKATPLPEWMVKPEEKPAVPPPAKRKPVKGSGRKSEPKPLQAGGKSG